MSIRDWNLYKYLWWNEHKYIGLGIPKHDDFMAYIVRADLTHNLSKSSLSCITVS